MRIRPRRSGKALVLSALAASFVVMFSSPNFTAAMGERLEISDDVLVEKFPNRSLYLDFARPTGNGPFPLIVLIHGGGWSSGNRKQMRQYMLNLAKSGYAAACVEYRLSSEAKYPAQINDSAQAINHLIDRAAEYKINTSKIALYGISAGGHVALILSGVQNDIESKSLPLIRLHAPIRATASLAGPTDLSKKFPPLLQGLVNRLFSKNHRMNKQAIALDHLFASPTTFIDAHDPPILLVHGTEDKIVPFDQAQELISRCRQKNADADLISIKGADHSGGGNLNDWTNSMESILKFLRQHLS